MTLRLVTTIKYPYGFLGLFISGPQFAESESLFLLLTPIVIAVRTQTGAYQRGRSVVDERLLPALGHFIAMRTVVTVLVSELSEVLFFKHIRNKRNSFSFISFICIESQQPMNNTDKIVRPTKEEQRAAIKSYNALVTTLNEIHSDYPEIEIEETNKRIQIPLKALKLLAEILKATSQGKPISIVPIATELTTQASAELIGCSRPHLIKLLEKGEIKYTKIGKHRRIKYQDVLEYKKKVKLEQRKLLIEVIQADEESGLYDS